jgi:hypothetical protein
LAEQGQSIEQPQSAPLGNRSTQAFAREIADSPPQQKTAWLTTLWRWLEPSVALAIIAGGFIAVPGLMIVGAWIAHDVFYQPDDPDWPIVLRDYRALVDLLHVTLAAAFICRTLSLIANWRTFPWRPSALRRRKLSLLEAGAVARLVGI